MSTRSDKGVFLRSQRRADVQVLINVCSGLLRFMLRLTTTPSHHYSYRLSGGVSRYITSRDSYLVLTFGGTKATGGVFIPNETDLNDWCTVLEASPKIGERVRRLEIDLLDASEPADRAGSVVLPQIRSVLRKLSLHSPMTELIIDVIVCRPSRALDVFSGVRLKQLRVFESHTLPHARLLDFLLRHPGLSKLLVGECYSDECPLNGVLCNLKHISAPTSCAMELLENNDSRPSFVRFDDDERPFISATSLMNKFRLSFSHLSTLEITFGQGDSDLISCLSNVCPHLRHLSLRENEDIVSVFIITFLRLMVYHFSPGTGLDAGLERPLEMVDSVVTSLAASHIFIEDAATSFHGPTSAFCVRNVHALGPPSRRSHNPLQHSRHNRCLAMSRC